jgi:hypothetical protein
MFLKYPYLREGHRKTFWGLWAGVNFQTSALALTLVKLFQKEGEDAGREGKDCLSRYPRGGGPGAGHLSLPGGQRRPIHGRGGRGGTAGTWVYLAKQGYAEHVLAPGLTPLKTLIDSFVANGGKILVCMPCIEERKISQADLIQGTELIKAGRLVVEMTSAKSTAVY